MIEFIKEILMEYGIGYEAVVSVITLIVLLASLYVIVKK